jgi:hypothetical protein
VGNCFVRGQGFTAIFVCIEKIKQQHLNSDSTAVHHSLYSPLERESWILFPESSLPSDCSVQIALSPKPVSWLETCNTEWVISRGSALNLFGEPSHAAEIEAEIERIPVGG